MCMLSFLLKLISKYLRLYLDNKFALDFAAAVDVVLLEKVAKFFNEEHTKFITVLSATSQVACAIHNPYRCI